jgi:hypothetical protein
MQLTVHIWGDGSVAPLQVETIVGGLIIGGPRLSVERCVVVFTPRFSRYYPKPICDNIIPFQVPSSRVLELRGTF